MQTQQTKDARATSEERSKFHALIRDFDNAILVTNKPEGTSHARPMAVADVGEGGELWFVARDDSAKVDEVRSDPRALVVMQDSSKHLVVNGHARIVRDQQKVEELWRETWRVWFKDKHDPNLVLIQVQPDEAEYWDNSGTDGLKFLLKAAAAYVSGREMTYKDDDPKIHGKVSV